jgi:glucose/arabinose dehydrogenase
MITRRLLTLAVFVGVVGLSACTSESTPPRPSPTDPSTTVARPTGDPKVIASGLEAPWSILRLGDGDSTLISERDSGVIEELTASNELRKAGTVGGVAHDGEGGLLGLEDLRDGDNRWIYAYLTTASDNRIVRMPLLGKAGDYSLGPAQKILTGLAKAANHDGGRIKFGPDGMLYATVGDAGQADHAQDPESLNGKILRMTPRGGVPDDNPTAGSLIYSLGHRNPQGLAWDASGQLWAAEFGQNTWDELNRIEPGGDYGWPIVEGKGGDADFIDPVYQWSTAEASPSGLAFVDGTFFLAALRGERLWAIYPGTTTNAVAYLAGTLGRIRDVVAGPDGTLWLLTNNTDGRGTVHEGDDKLVQVGLDIAGEG